MTRSTRRILVTVQFLAAALVAVPASATEFSLGGYYRLRLELFKSLSAGVGLNGYPDNATTGYWQHRVRLDPKVKLNDNVAFYAQIDMLDNTIAGDNPEIESAYGNTLPEFLSQGVLPQQNTDASGNDVGSTLRNISVKRAWGEVLTGVGQLKFGRMGSHWGLGILANDGNGWDDDFGDTVDRIMFITKAGPIYLVPMVDKVSEGEFLTTGRKAVDIGSNNASLSKGSDDVDEFIMVAVYRGELSSSGVYGVYRIQPSTDTQVMIGDGWAKTKIGPVAAEVEGAWIQGKTFNPFPPNAPVHVTARQWGFAAETSVPMKKLTPGFNFGAASGDDKSGPTNGTLNNFVFDRDYHIAYLLFRYVGNDGAPRAVTDAIYVKPHVSYEVLDNLTAEASVIYAQTLSDMPTYGKGPYGTEGDFGASWKLYDDFEMGVRYGILLPGKALKPTGVGATGKLDSVVHGIEGHFLIRF